jgi:tetratricopeptide (TPR) repeat protein
MLVERIERLGLKQWWIARTVGVTTKTVGRWVSGRVKRIDRRNAERLAEVLECSIDTLTTPADVEVVATREDQRQAAELLRQKELLALLAPSENWELAESLIKATMQPNLPLEQLGHLYNLLSITAWRQRNYGEGERNARRALEIGERCGDRGVIHKANCNLATIAWFVGRPHQALGLYEICLAEPEEFASEIDHASALANLGALYCDLARFQESRLRLMQAIELLTKLGRSHNLAIAWINIFYLEIELGRTPQAAAALDHVERFASESAYRSGLVQARIYRGEIAVFAGDHATAVALVERGLKEIAELTYYDLGCHEIAARVFRRAGELDRAAEQLEIGFAATTSFRFIRMTLLHELARLRLAHGDSEGMRDAISGANVLAVELGLDARIVKGEIHEYGCIDGGPE